MHWGGRGFPSLSNLTNKVIITQKIHLADVLFAPKRIPQTGMSEWVLDDWNVQSDEKSVTAIIGIFASFVETEAGRGQTISWC